MTTFESVAHSSPATASAAAWSAPVFKVGNVNLVEILSELQRVVVLVTTSFIIDEEPLKSSAAKEQYL